MRKNERTDLNKIIEDLKKVHNNIEKEREDDYNFFDIIEERGLWSFGEFVDDEMNELEEIINRLSELSKKQGGINMKINTKKHNFEEMYQVGNVIQWINGNIYLVVDHGELDYSLVDLTNNKVYATYDTLENLISDLASESDVLVNAEIKVFQEDLT